MNCERLPCMSTVRDISTRLEPLEMSQMQPGSLQNLSFISVNHIPTGDHLMVLIDKYSIYPVLEDVSPVPGKSVVPVLDKVLSVFGFLKVIKCDNGSPFNSTSFADYLFHRGFEHCRTTPHWPQANAQGEAFNKPLITVIHVAHLKGKNGKQLYKYL